MQAFTTLKTALRPEHAYVAGTCCTTIASRREYRCVITVDLKYIGFTVVSTLWDSARLETIPQCATPTTTRTQAVKIGKVIVASTPSEAATLQRIIHAAKVNGVDDLAMLDRVRLSYSYVCLS